MANPGDKGMNLMFIKYEPYANEPVSFGAVCIVYILEDCFVQTFNKCSDSVPFGFVLATTDCFRLLLSCPHWFLSVSVAFAIAWWHKSDTWIYHLSTHMVNSKLHIYHPVCNLPSRYRMRIHVTAWKTAGFFQVLKRTGCNTWPCETFHTII